MCRFLKQGLYKGVLGIRAKNSSLGGGSFVVAIAWPPATPPFSRVSGQMSGGIRHGGSFLLIIDVM